MAFSTVFILKLTLTSPPHGRAQLDMLHKEWQNHDDPLCDGVDKLSMITIVTTLHLAPLLFPSFPQAMTPLDYKEEQARARIWIESTALLFSDRLAC